MGDIFSLAKKLERAVRNGSGCSVSADEMRLLVDGGIFGQIHALKVKELEATCLGRAAPTSSETTGSTSAEMASLTHIWQITTYKPGSRQVVYRSTKCSA
jgi:hypothetical protein